MPMRFMAINIQVGSDCKHQLLCSAIYPRTLHNLCLQLTSFLQLPREAEAFAFIFFGCRYDFFLRWVCFVHILIKTPFSWFCLCSQRHSVGSFSKADLFSFFYHIPSEIDKWPAVVVNLVIASLYMYVLNFSQPSKTWWERWGAPFKDLGRTYWLCCPLFTVANDLLRQATGYWEST